jgi:threonylcarbamoyladenosine tRNA methylthiotransferase MtaB
LNELNVSYLHVFTYSERPNTAAIAIKPTVPQNKRAERSKMLHILSDKKKRFFYENQIGKQFSVLFEEDVENIATPNGNMHGWTENYVRVTAKYDPVLVNETKEIRLVSINNQMLVEVEELVSTSV